MKTLVAFVTLLSLALASDSLLDGRWDQFKRTFGKSYPTRSVEARRRSIWEENLRFIDQHNQEAANGQHSYTVAINSFADLTSDEYRALNGFKRSANTERKDLHVSGSMDDLPDSVDWRTKGYVTEVKNQKKCGSCWAFSAVAALEGQNFKKTGKLVDLSEQNLVDCDTKDYGCDGGLMNTAFEFIKEQNGIDTEEAYPYTGKDGKCSFDPEKIGATCSGYKSIKEGSEEDLQEALATVGPISVAIDASGIGFQFYKEGVYDSGDCSSEELNHGVTAVGYGTEGGKAFWIVKNSWGKGWGDKGYIKMARNKDNHCGIATEASYPLV